MPARTKKKPALKANTKRSGGRVVPMKGYKFTKGGKGRVVKVKAGRK